MGFPLFPQSLRHFRKIPAAKSCLFCLINKLSQTFFKHHKLLFLQIIRIVLADIKALSRHRPDQIVKLVLFLIFVMAQLPLAVIYGRYVKQRLDDAVCYETWQRRAA